VTYPYGAPEPGEQPPYAPYGSNPYGGAPASPYGKAGQDLDGVSIAGFVLSLLCCTGFVGVILGIIGLSRTKAGDRRGRWAAVSAIAIGVVGTLASAATLVFFVWFGTNTVLLDSADVGQCVNVDELSGGGHDATLWDKDCEESHEAEIVVTGDFTAAEAADFDDGLPAALCQARLREPYVTAYADGGYYLGIVTEASEPESGDRFICYLERLDGDDLTAPIG
jgi:hypothetical protein